MFLRVIISLIVTFTVRIRWVKGCLGENFEATNSHRYFSSPGYPSTYSSNANCSWLITAVNAGRVLQLEFIASDLEDSGLCVNDAISIYDGSSSSSPHLLTFCGTRKPSLYSTGSAFYVQFTSNGALEFTGFQARYFQKAVESTGWSFETLVSIICVTTFLVISLIIFITCAHRSWTRKLADTVSRMSISQGPSNKVGPTPLDSRDSYPVLPDKPVGKQKDTKVGEPIRVTKRDKTKIANIPVPKRVQVMEARGTSVQDGVPEVRILKREQVKVAHLPLPKRAQVIENTSNYPVLPTKREDGVTSMPERTKKTKKTKESAPQNPKVTEVKDYPVLPTKKNAKPYTPTDQPKSHKGGKSKLKPAGSDDVF